eukprot:TRINITY_DN5109_c0_g2_i1.p1 TRINITY_DN5109_c0_g2~~TRINITY_DN5109_c0_g2_i1.p1  ORF type:complete len:857 (+),score=409.25 TRINITY_DN5109_c0_g2_i1:97-2667(+)
MADKPPDDSIKVCARFRPMNRLETEAGGRESMNIPNNKTCELRLWDGATQGGGHSFTFDHVFPTDTKQRDVYDIVGRPVVADIFKGYNGTIFVYGQTGSGKSHTMMGPTTTGFCEDTEMQGIIPRVVDQIFINVEESDPAIEFSIKVSYVEIYMEKIRDLLEPSKQNLQLREDFKGGKGVYIADVVEQYVADPDEIFELMKAGAANRVVASTHMNDVSSRSHAIFCLNLTQKHSKNLDQKSGKLFLVDLAGSEKVGKTGAQGQQLEEAKLINKSLSCLGQVINALTDRKSTHIPYRDSKLTRLLQDSLGGNSRTSLIICGSMSEYNQQETLSTLRFGQRAKSIKNNAKVNRELTVAEYKILVAKMEKEVAALKKGIVPTAAAVPADIDTAADTAKLEAELQEERANIATEREELQIEMQGLREADQVKSSLIGQYKTEMGMYREEVEGWEEECAWLAVKMDELKQLVEKEGANNADKMAVIGASNLAATEIGKDALSMKASLQKIDSHLEQQSLSANGTLDEDQEKEVAQWRRERDQSRQEEQSFRESLLGKIETFTRLDRELVSLNSDRVKELSSEINEIKKDGWGRALVAPGGSGALPDSLEARGDEILRLRRAVADFERDDVVAKSAWEDSKEAYAQDLLAKEGTINKLKTEMDRHVSESKELRMSLLKDLQSRCEKVIDLEMSLDESREQFKQLMVASSNKLLRKRVQLLEQQHDQQTGNIAEILNENSTLRLEFKLAEKKLAIRNERIENLKTGLKEEKRHMKELRDSVALERAKFKQEAARFKEELHFWKDKCIKAASAATASAVHGSKAGRIIKVLKGGHKHDQLTPQKSDLDDERDLSPAGAPPLSFK